MQFDSQGFIGFDVSKWQDANTTLQQIDFVKMKQDCNARFVIIKAGQYDWMDEDFVYNWNASGNAGLPRAAYWFCDKARGGKAQAVSFYEILLSVGWDGEPVVADYEGGSWTDWNELYNFLVEIQKLTQLPDHKIWIYTGYYYWVANSPTNQTSLDWFGRFPLWIAWYTNDPAVVKIPAPWDTAFLWQKGTPAIGKQCGAESEEIDLDELNGGQDKLDYYFGGGGTTPPDTGGTMNGIAKEKLGKTSTVRTSPEVISGNDAGVRIQPYSEIEFTEIVDGPNYPGDRWFKLTDGNYVNYIYNGRQYYDIIQDPGTEPPPVGDGITVDVSVTVDPATAEVTQVLVNDAEYIKK